MIGKSKMAILLFLLLILGFGRLQALTFPNNRCQKAFQMFVHRQLDSLRNTIEALERQMPDEPWPNWLKVLWLCEQGGTNRRIEAKKLLDRFAPTYRADPFAYFVRGYFLKTGRWLGLSRTWFQKALQLDPYFVEAMVELGDAYRQEMLRYQQRWTNTDVALSLEAYAEESYRKAKQYLLRALQLLPDHYRARYLLGLLYYDHGDWRPMVRLFEEGSRLHPDRPEWYLWMGLVYQEQGEYARADDYFEQAMVRLPDSLRSLFTDRSLLENEFVSDESPATRLDWSELDPLYLSRENERLTEHMARLAYVQLKFGVPALDLPGWKTDRGQVYLHFGKPKRIIRFGKAYSEMGTILPPAEIWVYPDFTFLFEDEFWNGNYRFAVPSSPLSKSPFRSRSRVNYEWVAGEVYREYRDYFEFRIPGGRFELNWQFLCFKGTDPAETEVMVLLDIPLRQFPDLDSLQLEGGLFVRRRGGAMKQKWYAVWEPFRSIENLFPYRRRLLYTARFRESPGKVYYSLEVRERSNAMISVQRDSLEIAGFAEGRLAMSDIVLARRIRSEPRNLPPFRHGYYIEPALDHRFSQKNLLNIYFEVYFLQKASDNTTLYLVENTLIPKENVPWWRNWLKQKQTKISILNEYQGQRRHDYVMVGIRLDHVVPGEYWLEIRVTDRYAGRSVSKRVPLIVEAK